MTITVKGPNGVTINFPDGTDQSVIDRAMREAVGGQPTPSAQSVPAAPSVGKDIALSAGRGALEGVLSIPGIVGDVMDVAAVPGRWLGDKARQVAGKPPLSGPANDPLGLTNIPGSRDIIAGFDEMTGGRLQYDPQTTAGKYARTVGQFVPGAVVLGGGGMVGRVATGVAGGLGSEAAGQVTSGTSIEPYARMTGGLVGAMGGGLATTATKAARMPKVPAFQAIADRATALRSQADRLYKSVDRSGVRVDPLSLQAGVQRIKAAIRNAGHRLDYLPAETKRALRNVEDLASQPTSFSELDKLRQIVRDSYTTTNPTERFLAGLMTRELDGFVASLSPVDMVSGLSPSATAASLNRARSLWSQGTRFQDKARLIDNIWESALDKVGANYTAAGIQTALRQEFRALSKKIRQDQDLARIFTSAERTAITDIVRGSKIETVLRNMGKMAPTSPTSLAFTQGALAPASAGIGYLMQGGTGAAVGALAPAAIGLGLGLPARMTSNLMQRQSLDRLIDTILNSGQAVARQAATPMTGRLGAYYGISEIAPAFSTPRPVY